MSNKRYYWLKLKEDFFEDDTIQWLEDQENGVEYTLFYLKLCLKSLKNDGKLVRFVGDFLMPYDKKTLSKLTNTDADTVAVAMDLFKKIGLIDIFESGEIYMKQIEEMVGSETDSAIRKRRSRARIEQDEKIQLELPEQSRDNVTSMSKNVTQSKSIEIEKDIEKEQEQEQENSGDGSNSVNVHRFYQNNFGVESGHIMQDLNYWIEDLTEPVVQLALEKAVENGSAYNYAKGIMKNWANKGIKSVEDALAESNQRQRKMGWNNGQLKRIEKLPDWVDEKPVEKEEEMSEDTKKAFEERLARIRAKRKGVANENT